MRKRPVTRQIAGLHISNGCTYGKAICVHALGHVMHSGLHAPNGGAPAREMQMRIARRAREIHMRIARPHGKCICVSRAAHSVTLNWFVCTVTPEEKV